MEQGLWVKEVDNPVSRPLDEWRYELYGYWMLVTNMQTIDGERTGVARYYGTDREKILDLWGEFNESSSFSEVGFFCNKKSKWMGGAFLVTAES